MTRILKINLSNFRNHAALRLAPAGVSAVIVTGPNGAGKTNVLEAVSLLGPGRGLRGAELTAMQGEGTQDPWAVSAEIETGEGEVLRVGTGLSRDGKRRVARVQGKISAGHAELGHLVPAVWLTPQMDGLFTEAPAARRRFVDRLVFSRDPAHAARLSAAEKNTRARLRLLTDARIRGRAADPAWLSALEEAMSGDFLAVAAARTAAVAALSLWLKEEGAALSPFPLPLAEMTSGMGDLRAPGEIRARLEAGRAADAAAGRTLFGPHRGDLSARLAMTGRIAAECSTGEQKGMLAALVLAQAFLLRRERGAAPLILLDDLPAHLDAARRDALFRVLSDSGAQAWLTGTDAGFFAELGAGALRVRLGD